MWSTYLGRVPLDLRVRDFVHQGVENLELVVKGHKVVRTLSISILVDLVCDGTMLGV